MKLSRPLSWFLLAFGVWSWCVWTTFVKNLIKDGSGLAFDAGHPTAYFWIHLALAVVSFLLGTVIGVVGFRGLRALRREAASGPAERPAETADVTDTTHTTV
ncbi:SCO4848 family membrane protein [Streptomyces sp. NPDC059740]|uniref:SCO4848 family membrane protein n=1 Tax=Streptomyces sp. NPDC059740 TaxID=3346926 RepID=UPI00364A2F1B